MDIQSLLVCPISLDLMDDPVTVHESGITYDRSSLSDSLRRFPDLDPSTGQRFGHPLHFTANVTLLQIIELVRLDRQLPPSPASHSEARDSLETTVQSLLLCPISLEVMEDPVIMHESGIVYDRKSLCFALLARPNLEPQTGRTCTHPLEFTPCIVMRTLIELLYGESQLRRHDDSLFHKFYQEATGTTVPGRPDGRPNFNPGRTDGRDRPNPAPSAPMEEASSTSRFGSSRPDPPATAEVPRGDEERGPSAPAHHAAQGSNGSNRPIPARASSSPGAQGPAPARSTNSCSGCKVAIVVATIVFVFYFVVFAASSNALRVSTARAISRQRTCKPNSPLQQRSRIVAIGDGETVGSQLASDPQWMGFCHRPRFPGRGCTYESAICKA